MEMCRRKERHVYWSDRRESAARREMQRGRETEKWKGREAGGIGNWARDFWVVLRSNKKTEALNRKNDANYFIYVIRTF